MTTTVILIAVSAFVGVAALVAGVAMALRGSQASHVEDRLAVLTGQAGSSRESLTQKQTLLLEPLAERPNFLEAFLCRCGKLQDLLIQADVTIRLSHLGMMIAALAAGGLVICAVLRLSLMLWPVAAAGCGLMPIGWVLWRRKKRLKAFAAQLPDALDMLARALRAGQSLSAGFGLIAKEMPEPISKEFGRVFEEQNLGVSVEESLRDLTHRVPNLDLKFFATAVILQRQTGGDLAEILDKIGHLIRQRFQIWGQVQALTGEGRLSGVVLLALPIFLFFVVYYLNPDYLMVLFTDPLGKKMMAGAIVMQIIGALVIRKIVNIKV